MIIAGVGLKSNAQSKDIAAAIEAALATHGRARNELNAIATHADKATAAGLREAAEQFALPVLAISSDAMHAVADRALTSSSRSLEITGLPSVCETAALAAAGADARLLGPRTKSATATCALAESDPEAPA